MNDLLVWHSMFQLQVSRNCLIAGFFHKSIASPSIVLAKHQFPSSMYVGEIPTSMRF